MCSNRGVAFGKKCKQLDREITHNNRASAPSIGSFTWRRSFDAWPDIRGRSSSRRKWRKCRYQRGRYCKSHNGLSDYHGNADLAAACGGYRTAKDKTFHVFCGWQAVGRSDGCDWQQQDGFSRKRRLVSAGKGGLVTMPNKSIGCHWSESDWQCEERTK